MGLFDIFSNKWSAGKMAEDDRKKLFWYLKRKTSYTAWKREADAFDRFAEIFERQVKEEPIAKAGKFDIYDTNWERFYPEILKAQMLYEKALVQLLQGDRTIWLNNERGLMADAWTISQSWHSNLVVRRAEWHEIALEGKYVKEMTDAIKEFYRVSRDTGYIQPMMAGGRAHEWWGEALECILNNEDFPRKPLPGFPAPEKMASYIKYPVPLPEVPIPKTEILVKTGEDVPVFGIYEPLMKDGCMNYLLQGVLPAPFARDAQGEKLPVTWKLIWEDTRYLDGQIPAEEHLYFPPEPKTETKSQPEAKNDLISAMTGQECPKTGFWVVMDDLQGKCFLEKSDIMPKHNGREVTWVRVD